VIEVRTELTEREGRLVALARLADLAPVEAWTVQGTSRALAYSTHGVFRYFGKFPPPIAKRLITTFSAPGDLVLDPMAGSGTTAVEALSLGRGVVVRDVSPLSLLLCRVKTTHVGWERAQAAFERVREREAGVRPSEQAVPVGLRNAEHWFLPVTMQSLGRLRAAIEPETDQPLRELLMIAFASTVRRVSRATTEQGRLFLDRASAKEQALPTFEERFSTYARAVAALPSATPELTLAVEELDAKSKPVEPRRFRLAIVHPPYFNNYKYSSINALELAWLGFSPKAVRPHEIREAFKVGKPERATAYVNDLTRALLAVEAELGDDAVLALMMGDTFIRDEYVDVTRRVISALAEAGSRLALDRVVLRVPKYTEASWVASQRRRGDRVGVTLNDFILIFRGQA
jgi:site-specific DNA-methyltransferase (cytosine-N4-specific)